MIKCKLSERCPKLKEREELLMVIIQQMRTHQLAIIDFEIVKNDVEDFFRKNAVLPQKEDDIKIHGEDIRMEKKHFVESRLGFLVQATNPEVTSVQYVSNNQGEFVEIIYAEQARKRVNVTADSILALSRDVLKAL